MTEPPPKCYVPYWWRRALDDGKHCENKRREHYFHEYIRDAHDALKSAGLVPQTLSGVFRFWYRRGFRLGYDNAVELRKAERRFLPRKKKRAKLGK